MGLDSETLRRLAACFAGRACCRYGTAAVRLAHGRFHHDRHFPLHRGQAVQPPKARRCLLGG